MHQRNRFLRVQFLDIRRGLDSHGSSSDDDDSAALLNLFGVFAEVGYSCLLLRAGQGRGSGQSGACGKGEIGVGDFVDESAV